MADVYYSKLVSGINAPLETPAWLRRNFLAIKLALQNRITPGEFRTLLELGTIATQDADNVSITGGTITGVAITASPVSFKAVETTLSGNVVLTSITGNYFFYNAGGLDRQVKLWSPSGGAFAHFENTGTSGNLDLVDSGSLAIYTVVPGEIVTLMWSGSSWRKI